MSRSAAFRGLGFGVEGWGFGVWAPALPAGVRPAETDPRWNRAPSSVEGFGFMDLCFGIRFLGLGFREKVQGGTALRLALRDSDLGIRD